MKWSVGTLRLSEQERDKCFLWTWLSAALWKIGFLHIDVISPWPPRGLSFSTFNEKFKQSHLDAKKKKIKEPRAQRYWNKILDCDFPTLLPGTCLKREISALLSHRCVVLWNLSMRCRVFVVYHIWFTFDLMNRTLDGKINVKRVTRWFIYFWESYILSAFAILTVDL